MDVIPPLTDIDSASETIFLSITHAMLTDTSVVETPPAAYNGATSYDTGDQASDLSANLILVYESLIDSNVGNTPASSPAEWALIGTTYPVYSGATSYALDDYAIDATNHLEYKSLVGSNLGNALSDTTKWQLQGATNRFKAFNLIRSTPTVSPSPMVFEITPGTRVDAIALFGLVAHSVTVEVIVAAEVIFTATEDLSARTTTSWSEYFFGGFTYLDRLARLDLPPYAAATIRVTIERTSGDVSCGRLILGKQVYVGVVEARAKDGEQNFSSVDRAFDGSVEIVPRRSIATLNCTVKADASADRKLRKLRADLNATPAAWIGLRDAAHNYYESLAMLGLHRQFDIELFNKDELRAFLEIVEA